MASTTIFSGAADAYIDCDDAGGSDYAHVREGTLAFVEFQVVDASATQMRMGQKLSAGQYDVYETFLAFDLSSIAGGTCTGATLSLYGAVDNSVTDFTIEARERDWGATVTTDDWVPGSTMSGLTRLATFATVGFSVAGYNDFTQDGTNLVDRINAALSGSGVLSVLLCSAKTVAGTAPTGQEWVAVFAADQAGTGNDPKLAITYTPAAGGSDTADPYGELGFFGL